jgi:hypothetical protein
MKKLVLAIIALLVPAAGAKVWTTVYRCDEVTPLAAVDPNHPTVYRDIMVGTRLAIVISSDAKGPWSGNLVSTWDDWVYGELAARGYNPATRNYDSSCLPAAGKNPFTLVSQDSTKVGFHFGSRVGGVPGDWFILDYKAKQAGLCNLSLWTIANPKVLLGTLSFQHVPSRDFNGDTVVDFRDFSLLTSHWNATVALDPNSPGRAFDLDSDARIGMGDLALFSEYWLERTDCTKPADDPNDPLAGNP